MKKHMFLISLSIITILILAGCQYDSAGKSWVKTPSIKTTKTMPAQETRTIFRCWYSYHGVANHYLSFNNNCEGNNVDGIIGHLYTTQKEGTIPIYQCYRQTRHDRKTFTDHFTSLDQNCEGQKFDKLLGFAPAYENADTVKRYRCWPGDSIRHGRFDHMVSADYNCEGFTHREQTYFFLKQPIYIEECTGDIKDYLENNQQKNYALKYEYEVTAMMFNDKVKFKVNGEITEALGIGDYDILTDGAKIQVSRINPGKGAYFCLTAGKIQIKPNLILVNDGAPADDVIISVDAAQFLGSTNTETKLDSEVLVNSLLRDRSLVVRIFLSDVNVFVNPARISESAAQNLVNHLKQNPRVSDASYKILSVINVRDLAEYSQQTTTTYEASISQINSTSYTGTFNRQGESFQLDYNPITKILTITYPDSTHAQITIDSNNMGTWNYKGTTFQIEIDISNNRIIFVE